MRIPQKKSNKRLKTIVAVVAVAVIAGGVLTYLYFSAPKKSASSQSTINYNPPTQEEKSTGDTIKEQGTSGSDPSPQPTPSTSQSDTRSTVGMDISAVNQSTDTLSIRTLIQTVSSSGTCTISMKGPDSKTYTATADVQAGPSSTTCKGFDIPVSSLSKGPWSVSISFQNSSVKGSATKDITVK